MRGSITITTCTEDADAMSNDTISLKRQEEQHVRSVLLAEGQSGVLGVFGWTATLQLVARASWAPGRWRC